MRVRIYARVSSEDQEIRETIQNQVDFGTKYCDLHKLEITDWYKDEDVSGLIPLEERPEGNRLLKEIQKGELLLVYALDRLGRSARVILNAIYSLEQKGIKVRSMSQPFDTGDASGRFLVTILAGVAELERENILARLWLGAQRAAKNGKWLGGIVPYGYRKNDDGFLEISEEPLPGCQLSEAEAVRRIYSMLAEEGRSCKDIADYLNALGVPTSYAIADRKIRRGKRLEKTTGVWRPGRIRNMVVNTVYKGIHYYGRRSKKERELIPRKVPAIVDPVTWDLAQQTLRNNQLEATRNAKRQYLLRSLIKCGICGRNYSGTAYNGPAKGQTKWYVCNGKSIYPTPTEAKCTNRNVPGDWIETEVWENIISFVENPGDALQEFAATFENRKSRKLEIESEAALVRHAAKEKETEKQSVLDLYRRKIITLADLEEQIAKISAEAEELEKRAVELEASLESEIGLEQYYANAEDLLTVLRERIRGDLSFEEKREIVKTLVKEIIVKPLPDPNPGKPAAEIHIHYMFPKDVTCTDKGSCNYLGNIVRSRRLPSGRGTEPTTDPFGARLRLLRLEAGLTIRRLANQADLSETALSAIEHGRATPSLPTLRKLSSVLGVGIADLAGYNDLPEKTLAQRICKARLCAGLTRVQLAKILSVDESSLCNWELGRRNPSNKKTRDAIEFFIRATLNVST